MDKFLEAAIDEAKKGWPRVVFQSDRYSLLMEE